MLLAIGFQYFSLFTLEIFQFLLFYLHLLLPYKCFFMAFQLLYSLEGDYYWAGGDRILEKGACIA